MVSDAWVWQWFMCRFGDNVELEGLSALGRVEKGLVHGLQTMIGSMRGLEMAGE